MSFESDCALAVRALQDYLTKAGAREEAVIRQPPMAELAGRLDLDRMITGGGLAGDRLERFLAEYLAASTRLHHPGYMAHQVAVPEPRAAVAALVDAVTNNAMAIYEMGPAAATVEDAVLRWMLTKAGWSPQTGAGVLTHGGSLANLTALLAARGRAAPEAWEDGTPRDLVVVTSLSSHYSIARAAALLGLGQNAVRTAPTDADGRMDPVGLAALLRTERAEGRRVMAVVANACGTALGLYDPLRPIAETCRAQGIWLHVDGAHGASALVSRTHRTRMDGIDLADSLVWDAHKMLRTPTLCAAVLTRDRRDLDAAFREEASYLFHDKDQPGFDFIHRTVECTKAGLGLKAFFALAVDGEAALEAYVDRQFALARDAAALLRRDGFTVAAEPQANIVCFRTDGSDDDQLAIRRHLTQAGDHYLSSAEHGGRRWLRLTLMNPATGLEDVAALATAIRRLTR